MLNGLMKLIQCGKETEGAVRGYYARGDFENSSQHREGRYTLKPPPLFPIKIPFVHDSRKKQFGKRAYNQIKALARMLVLPLTEKIIR